MTARQLEDILTALVNAEGIHAVVNALAEVCNVKGEHAEKARIGQAWVNAMTTLEHAEREISDFIKS